MSLRDLQLQAELVRCSFLLAVSGTRVRASCRSVQRQFESHILFSRSGHFALGGCFGYNKGNLSAGGSVLSRRSESAIQSCFIINFFESKGQEGSGIYLTRSISDGEGVFQVNIAVVHYFKVSGLVTAAAGKGTAAEHSGIAGIQALPVIGTASACKIRAEKRSHGKIRGGNRIHAGLQGVAEPGHRRPNQHDCTQKHAENADAQRAVQAGFLWLAVPRAEPVRTIHFHNGTSFLMI